MATQGVLFVSHDATQTGAPIALLHFLRWFKENSERPFAVLLGNGGAMIREFEEVAPTWSADRSRWQHDALRTQLARWAGFGEWARRADVRDVRSFANRISPALVYANSIASARLIEVLKPKAPVITHVHELEFMFQKLASPELERLMAGTQRFVACSEVVRENLVHGHGVARERIEMVHESIPIAGIRTERTREEILQELRLPTGAQIVVGVGTPSWRKGTDLFVQLARAVCQQRSHVYFVWVGGGPSGEFEFEVRASGLGERVQFTGARPMPTDYLAAGDVFALTSREDPYPLAALEAAAVGRPIVCFADGGGMPEFVEEDCGFIVPYLDVAAMANRVVSLIDCAEQRREIGEAARRKVAERHDTSLAGPRIAEIIERAIAERSIEGWPVE
jgi:glycosyltransferase involved in cell wall biosynthesis